MPGQLKTGTQSWSRLVNLDAQWIVVFSFGAFLLYELVLMQRLLLNFVRYRTGVASALALALHRKFVAERTWVVVDHVGIICCTLIRTVGLFKPEPVQASWISMVYFVLLVRFVQLGYFLPPVQPPHPVLAACTALLRAVRRGLAGCAHRCRYCAGEMLHGDVVGCALPSSLVMDWRSAPKALSTLN